MPGELGMKEEIITKSRKKKLVVRPRRKKLSMELDWIGEHGKRKSANRFFRVFVIGLFLVFVLYLFFPVFGKGD